MKTWVLLPAALLALSGCNSNKGSSDAAKTQPSATANAAAPPAPAAAPASAGGERAPELAGRWTGVNDCSQWLELRADGVMTNSEGANGTWSTRRQGEDLALTMVGGGQAGEGFVENLEEDSFDLTDGRGTTGATLTRCS